MNRILVGGKMLSPGQWTGILRLVRNAADAHRVSPGDIVCGRDLTEFLHLICASAGGFVTGGSEADHTIAYIREWWKPAIRADMAEIQASEGLNVTLDADRGVIFDGHPPTQQLLKRAPLSLRPSTKILLFVSVPEMAQRSALLNADGVGLVRMNLLIQGTGKHPGAFLESGHLSELEEILADGITKIASSFGDKPVWVRTTDFSTSDLKRLAGGPDEPSEENPMMGWRGIARGLDQVEQLRLEFCAIRRALTTGCTNVGILFPLVRTIREYESAKRLLRESGLIPHVDVKVGTMIETPAAALDIDTFIEAGLDLAFVGINDLTQYVLAADRSNPRMATIYDPANTAVQRLVLSVLEKCRRSDVLTSLSFQTPLLPVLGPIIRAGLGSVCVYADALNTVAAQLVREEGTHLLPHLSTPACSRN